MKKALLSLIVLAVLIGGILPLSACTKEVPIPGLAWASVETLVYDIKDNGESVGTLTVITEKLAPGEHKIDRLGERTFTVTANTAGGTRVRKTAVDKDGKEIMYSESLMNGFTSLASYKKVDYAGTAYEYRVYHEGKFFYYNTDGGNSYKRIKAKSGYLDNELLYHVVRCYDLDAGYASTYSVMSPSSESLEKIAVGTLQATVPFTIHYTDADGNEQAAAKECMVVSFSKSDSPKGTSIKVLYSPADFELKGNVDKLFNASIYLPVEIEENNIVYTLTSAVAA